MKTILNRIYHKKNILFLLIAIASIFFITACTQSQEIVCNKPYIHVGTSCCLDTNNNAICDNDETPTAPASQEGSEESISSANANAEIPDPEAIARKFAKSWESGQYEDMYLLFIPDLIKEIDKNRFAYVIEESKVDDATYSVRLDELFRVNDSKALAYFRTSGYSIFPAELPALDMIYTLDGWKFDGFSKVFYAECVNYPNLRFISDCPVDQECRLGCEALEPLNFGFPICTPELKCGCACPSIESIATFCNLNVAINKQEIKDNVCKTVSNLIKELNIEVKHVNESIIITNKEDQRLTQVSILVNNEYQVIIPELLRGEAKEIKEEIIKHINDGKPLRLRSLNSVYIYSDQGRYYKDIPSSKKPRSFTY